MLSLSPNPMDPIYLVIIIIAFNLFSAKMQKVKNLKELIWLHSNREFKDIQQHTRSGVNEIKFYKNNKGVEIRYQDASSNPDLDVIDNAKAAIQQLIKTNEIRLLEAQLTKQLYIKISREVRKQFENSYIVFLHYETFQNCCKKLKDKFGISSVETELERLKKENPHFCFLICQKERIDEIYEYTQKLLNLDVSIASTTVTRKVNKVEIGGFGMGKRSHSVKSLKGSFTSGGDELDQRFSINNSESDEEIYSINHQLVEKLLKPAFQKMKQGNRYCGRKVIVEDYKYSQYVDCKRRLYYTNRLQDIRNPHVQRIYAYNTYQNPISAQWRLSLVSQGYVKSFRQQMQTLTSVHHWRRKFLLLYRLGVGLKSIHSDMQSQPQLNPDTVYIDCQSRVLISGSSNKEIPPYTCPIQYDNRLYFSIIFWAVTGVEIVYEMVLKKLEKDMLMFTMTNRAKTKPNLEFLNLVNREFSKNIDLDKFLGDLKVIINGNY